MQSLPRIQAPPRSGRDLGRAAQLAGAPSPLVPVVSAVEITAALACSRPGCECVGAARKGSGDTHCPSHADTKPSLSVTEKGGTVLVHCPSGCTQEAVISALVERGLWGSPPSRNGYVAIRPVVAKDYSIKDGTGRLVAVHRRIERTNGKTFSWLRPDGSAGLNGTPSADLPLYRSEAVPCLPESAPVVVAEGEKAADALASVLGPKVGVLATVTGAAATPSDDVLGVLAGRRVVLWPDNDSPGQAHMVKVAEALQRVGAAEVKVADWPDAPAHGDAADYLIDHSRDDLLTLLRGAKTANYAKEASLGTAAPPLIRLFRLFRRPWSGPRRLTRLPFTGSLGSSSGPWSGTPRPTRRRSWSPSWWSSPAPWAAARTSWSGPPGTRLACPPSSWASRPRLGRVTATNRHPLCSAKRTLSGALASNKASARGRVSLRRLGMR